MIRGIHFPHVCKGDHCSVCLWEGRKLDGADALVTRRARARKYRKFGLCGCDWCLRRMGESGSFSESGSTGVVAPADPSPGTALQRTAKA